MRIKIAEILPEVNQRWIIAVIFWKGSNREITTCKLIWDLCNEAPPHSTRCYSQDLRCHLPSRKGRITLQLSVGCQGATCVEQQNI